MVCPDRCKPASEAGLVPRREFRSTGRLDLKPKAFEWPFPPHNAGRRDPTFKLRSFASDDFELRFEFVASVRSWGTSRAEM
jgi:hypothetical protein